MALIASERYQEDMDTERIRVCLLSGFDVEGPDGQLQFPAVASRLIAYLAVQKRPVSRSAIAGVLWPETTQGRAQASLRSSLWRVRKVHEDMVRAEHQCLRLADHVTVDLDVLVDIADRLESGRDPGNASDRVPISWFSCELLPDWYGDDDWLSFERERFRLMALRALEGMSQWHASRNEWATALECALAAVRLEPLRESSHRALIAAHIAQGNVSEAVREYRSYRRLLNDELGVEPSDHMTALLHSVGLSADVLNVA